MVVANRRHNLVEIAEPLDDPRALTRMASESAISVEMLGARPREAARTTSSTCVGESVIVIE